ncbi:MAG TPA: serine hydrolase [Puia sp.]|nr:serine hydrolase [Puia sp.]
MRSSAFYLLTLLFLCDLFCYGQKPVSSGKPGRMVHSNLSGEAAAFDRYIGQALSLWKTPGISVVVVKDDKVVFRKGYGVVESGKQAPFTTATECICASTTKAMTAVCMGMLVDSGKVSWDDKLKDVFPEFRLYDPYAAAELRVRDLFTHNAGLGNADLLWLYGYPREEILHRMKSLPPAYSLRSSFIYQNLMYIAAGELIRKLSGQHWEDFITQRLFAPIGMQHTYASFKRSEKEASHEVPHFVINDSLQAIPLISYENIGPAGGVWSCADDMDKWMLFLLDSAIASGGKRLLSAEVYKELFKPQALVTDKEFYPTAQLTGPHWKTYGLGWFQEDYRGKMVQFHTGSLDGAVAILGLLPSEHFGIYVFGNLDHSEVRHALMYKAMDLWAFHDNYRDWSLEFYQLYAKMKEDNKKKEKAKEALRVQGTRPSLPLNAYAGKYTNEAYGDAVIAVRGDSLDVQFPNDIVLKLGHWNYDVFAGIYNGWWDKQWIRFVPDGTGKLLQFDRDGVLYTKVDPSKK